MRARAARRQLHGLERVEAQAILQALAEAAGNKKVAADALGIARLTLYRKVRAFGVDLSGHTF
ncbi:helix-turn-helix domain-containing protein [Frankia canadensis]|uniref:helix-turn-helix domain-containing protein n=1 Tax=Frankia canadensis TaxID=1836972 RepID=UPI000C7B6525